MDIVTQVEGYQTHHFGSTSTITIWVVKDVNLKRFCRTEGINVSKGVMTGMIRPAGRKNVTVSVTGLDFNTPDSLMFNYIKKFGGSIISNEVIYSKFTEGPFRGKYSGERKYQVEFQKGFRSMGTYHFIDGAKIRIFYRGNEKSCGRCHEQARTCPGRGIARDCDKAGGPRVSLSEHMQRLWADIGFEPTTFALPTGDEESGEMDIPISEKERFSRVENTQAMPEGLQERFSGIRIANINLELTDEETKKFVIENLNDEIKGSDIEILRDHKKITATVSCNLNPKTITEAIARINFNDCKKKFFDRPLYCRPLRNITPEKTDHTRETSNPKSAEPSPKNIPGLPPNSQEKSKNKRAKKERQKLKRKEVMEEKDEGDVKLKTSLYEKMMMSRKVQDKVDTSKENTSITLGQQTSPLRGTSVDHSRINSLGSSPNLKRTSTELSSPNSPVDMNNSKRTNNRVVEEAVGQIHP